MMEHAPEPPEGERRICAMVRVRDEEEFLAPAVASIVEHVDEVVIIDNLSRDATPDIAAALGRAHPHRVRLLAYPHEVRRVGREAWALAEHPEGRASPTLSANFYNWCIERCRQPWVLKWDGDMVATARFHEALAAWRASTYAVMVFRGGNVHPRRRNLIAARSTDRDALLERLSVPGLPAWATSLTYDYPEPRLFPRAGAQYHADLKWTQSLSSPYLARAHAARHVMRVEDPLYLHMKFCKRDPWSGYSGDLAAVIAGNVTCGPPLDAAQRETVERFGLGSGGRSRSRSRSRSRGRSRGRSRSPGP
jgi:hypothetical protein